MNIREIAKEAGVSVATISRVLNHPEVVQADTRDRVLEVMKRNNYTPNWFARGLNLGKTRTIALFVPDIESEKYQMVMSGAETVALNKGYSLFICGTRHDARVEGDYLGMVLQRKVDGIILAGPKLSEQRYAELTGTSLPLVLVGVQQGRLGYDSCCVNYKDGVYSLATHLIKMGYRSIDLLLNDMLPEESAMIYDGFSQAVTDLGECVQSRRFEVDLGLQGGYFFAQRMIQSGNLPRAVITYNDEQAFGVIKSAQASGIRIPADLALAALSDSSAASLITPALTTLELPNKKLGMVAARMLIDRIDGIFSEEGGQEIILQPKLKVRHSCGNTKFIYEIFD
ncbi:MAG: LacI family DNA-binding transcriptional regulator [Candidatus Pelethousia sp.]|nr:LacI family DNA-binding transcriptional regulator [Candidatus Pelethousia sp.]